MPTYLWCIINIIDMEKATIDMICWCSWYDIFLIPSQNSKKVKASFFYKCHIEITLWTIITWLLRTKAKKGWSFLWQKEQRDHLLLLGNLLSELARLPPYTFHVDWRKTESSERGSQFFFFFFGGFSSTLS